MPEPTFYAIVAVAIEGFGRRTDSFQKSLRVTMNEVVRTAAAESGLDHGAIVGQDRDDGLRLLVPETPTAVLAGRFVLALDAGLREKAAVFGPAHAMRLRVALHQGRCEPDQPGEPQRPGEAGRAGEAEQAGESGRAGGAITTADRLVDAQVLRTTLALAERAAMAFIVSDEIYRGVIRHDYRLIDASAFGRTQLSVGELGHETVWIHVPGYPVPPGLGEEANPQWSTASGPGNGQTPKPGGGIAVNGSSYAHGDPAGGPRTIWGFR